ncbi:hypothetical protein EPN42_11320 [bacterium]|nr:MAG: hypothetical protein EPN42_11320 [bacterium]
MDQAFEAVHHTGNSVGMAKDESRKPTEWQRIGAELLGTFLLTFVAAGADIVEKTGGNIGHVARYAAPALLVMAMIWALSAISGAHINPAVTFVFSLRGSFPAFRIPSYILAQLVGAVGAAFLLRALFGGAIGEGITKPSLGYTDAQAVVIEIMLTFMLTFTIIATGEEEAVVGKNSALAVAGVIALSGFTFSPISGASTNPARSLGPMIAAGELGCAWIYLVGPLVGGALAAGCTWLLFGPPRKGEIDAAHGKHAH